MELQGVHYDAFISYRHAEKDSFVAENLHKRLEKFVLPKSVKTQNGKRKIERVFRDVDELPLSDNLSDPINNALANTDFLICVCTPRYLESKWCMKEIEIFLQSHDREHVLLVLAEDEPVNSFPKILTYAEVKTLDQSGNEVILREEKEPLAADVRGASKGEILKSMDNAVIKLCAAIFGLNYDDIKQRRHREKIKKLSIIYGSISVAIMCVAIFALVMLLKISSQNKIIAGQYEELSQKYAGSMATSAEKLLGEGLRKDAAYAVRSVLPEDEKSDYNSNAYYMLAKALGVYSVGDGFIPYDTYYVDGCVMDFKARKNGILEVMDITGNVYSFDVQTGKVAKKRECEEEEYFLGFDLPFNEKDVLNSWTDDEEYFTLLDAAGSSGETALLYYDYVSSSNYILIVDDASESVVISFSSDGTEYAYLEYENGIVYLLQCVLPDSGSAVSKCYAIDTYSGKTLWIKNLDNLIVTGIEINGADVFCTTNNAVIVLEKNYGAAMNYFMSENTILYSYIDEEEDFYFVDQKGNIFNVDEDVIVDVSSVKYEIAPENYVLQADYSEGSLYLLFPNSDYVTRYCAGNIGGEKTAGTWETVGGQIIGSADSNYSYTAEKSAMDFVERIFSGEEDFNILSVHDAFYSEDERFAVICMENGNVLIYNAENGELLQTLYDLGNGFIALKNYGDKYVLDSYSYSNILDEKFRMIGKTGNITGYEEGCFIVEDGENKYKIRDISYPELLKLADEYLGDYKPDKEIREKYNIQY